MGEEKVKPSKIVKGFKKALKKTGYVTGGGGRIGLCRCGHTGDAVDTDHVDHVLAGMTVVGHGQCTKCCCQQFTWVGFAE